MNRADCREAYKEFSAQASENVRQLSVAALGVIWTSSLSPFYVWTVEEVCGLVNLSDCYNENGYSTNS